MYAPEEKPIAPGVSMVSCSLRQQSLQARSYHEAQSPAPLFVKFTSPAPRAKSVAAIAASGSTVRSPLKSRNTDTPNGRLADGDDAGCSTRVDILGRDQTLRSLGNKQETALTCHAADRAIDDVVAGLIARAGLPGAVITEPSATVMPGTRAVNREDQVRPGQRMRRVIRNRDRIRGDVERCRSVGIVGAHAADQEARSVEIW